VAGRTRLKSLTIGGTSRPPRIFPELSSECAKDLRAIVRCALLTGDKAAQIPDFGTRSSFLMRVPQRGVKLCSASCSPRLSVTTTCRAFGRHRTRCE
jgi:hypothetical protein